MLKKLVMVFCLLSWTLPAVAQDVDTAWARIYNGTGDNSDYAYAIALDAIGNVCVTGQSWGIGTAYDYATIKYDSNGDTAWVRRYNNVSGNGSDGAVAVAVDGDNNVCVTGSSWNGANTDYVTIKYDPDGTQLWQETLNRWQDNARDIAADSSGNVYVTGFSSATPTAPFDFVTIKYDPDGETAWVRVFNGPANGDDSASAIVVDNSGNVYVTGQCKLMSSPYTLRGFGTIKYDPAGNFVWARFLSPPPNCNDYPLDIAVDDSGNVYVTGRGNGVGFDYLTVKYASDGTQLWVKTYNGPGNGSDFATGIAVDGYGNVYVTGQSVATSLDYATIKYGPDGNELWARRYDGGYTDDFASSIAADDSSNVYVTGGSIGDGTGFDYTTIKYDPDGNQLWVQRYNGAGSRDDNGNAIAVDGFGGVYVTGSCDLGFNAGDFGTMKYWQNYPPGSFSLLSPEDGVLIPPGVVNFDWENATDPDPWDTVKYDLYVSTSPVFHPDSTDIYDGLLTSDYSDDFGTGTYYWKVKAYDNHAEVWSNQTWSFVVASPLFGPATNYEVGNYPIYVFCADLDGDDDLDLAVANHEGQSVSILKNNGDGTFADTVNYAVSTHPFSAFCADLDGDGDLDLAVSCESGGVFILKNNGDGTFVDAGSYPGSDLRFLFCADLDEDDDLDIVVTTVQSDDVFILKNNGDGTFVNVGSYEVGDEPVYPFCADLDKDGDLDLAVANAYSNNISILKNNGDGTFQAKVDYPVEDGPHCVFPMDLDMDGDLDLAVTNGYEESGDSVSVLMNNGDGTFANAMNYKVGPYAFFLFSSDVDGDADFDLAVANSSSNNASILKNNGDGTFATAVNYETPSGPMYPSCADLDADGDFDLAVAIGNSSGHVVSILENLTQVPANQPPHPFSLLSPEDGSWAPQALILDWRTPYDPNFGDQIKYDLYISTVPTFDPDFTTIYSGLVTSRDTVTLGIDTYYWKVKAYDNWGAEVWSTQTWSFTTATSSGLVGYWKFDEGEGGTAHDVSGYGNDGTLVYEPTWVDGLPLLGKALDFDGADDYVEVPDAPSLDVNGPGITFVAWIHSPAFQNYGWIIGKGQQGPWEDMVWWLLPKSDGAIRYAIKSGGDTHEQWDIPVGLTTNIWQHVAVVYDGSYMRFYLNAAAKDSFPKTGNMDVNDAPVYIGLDGWNTANHYRGKIDEVKVYSRALSPEEIKAEFESGFTRGDANGDGIVNIGDVVCLVSYLYKNGPAPDPSEAGDCNCDGIVNLGDVVYLVSYLYKNGPPPSC